VAQRRLLTDEDFTEAMERNSKLRVFKDDHIIDTGSHVVRFDDRTVVTQAGVSDISYHDRTACEFYEMKKRG